MEHTPLPSGSSGERLAAAIMTAGHWQRGHTQAVEEQTPCTSQSCSPQLPEPWLGTLLAGGWQGVQRQLSGLPNQQPLQTLPGNSSTSGIKVLRIPVCDILNYWCQTPQSLLLMVFLATVFNFLVHNGCAEFSVHSKLVFNLMLTVKCQAAPRHPGLSSFLQHPLAPALWSS